LEKLEKKQKEKDDSERKKFETKLNLSNKLVETGLWTDMNDLWTDMNLVLQDLTDKEKREKIVTQINYYKKVLQAKGDNKLFVQSKVVKGKRVKLQTEDLYLN
jgi:hypothetical protein